MSDKNSNGVKLKFTTPQIITIAVLIVTLAITLVSKADKGPVQRNATEIELIKQRNELQYETIIYKLESIEKRLNEGG